MPKKEATKKISVRSTKKEMLDAYEEVVKQLEEKRIEEQKPEEKIMEKEAMETVIVADSLSMKGIGSEIGNLKYEIGNLLVQLSNRLEDGLSKYENVKKAVVLKEKELTEIYEIEKNASSLLALIDAQRMKAEELEVKRNREMEELEAEIEATRSEWEQEVNQHEAALKETAAEEKKKRERDAEEYGYSFQRKQTIAHEKFEDEKERIERELQLKRDQVEQELTNREQVLAEQEKEIEELRKKVSGFPIELENAVNKTLKDAKEKFTKEFESQKLLLVKEKDGERNVLRARIDSLDKSLQEKSGQIVQLSGQLEKSYGQVQDIAVKSIEGSANLKTISSIEQIISDKTHKKEKEE